MWDADLLQMILHSACWQPRWPPAKPFVPRHLRIPECSASWCSHGPILQFLKVKSTTADSPGKSLISEGVGPIWGSAVHCRVGCQEDPLKACAASYSPVSFWQKKKEDTFWQPSCCAGFMPTGRMCVRWCNHDVKSGFLTQTQRRQQEQQQKNMKVS